MPVVPNSFGTVGHVYALRFVKCGPDNFAHYDTIDTFIYFLFIVL